VCAPFPLPEARGTTHRAPSDPAPAAPAEARAPCQGSFATWSAWAIWERELGPCEATAGRRSARHTRRPPHRACARSASGEALGLSGLPSGGIEVDGRTTPRHAHARDRRHPHRRRQGPPSADTSAHLLRRPRSAPTARDDGGRRLTRRIRRPRRRGGAARPPALRAALFGGDAGSPTVAGGESTSKEGIARRMAGDRAAGRCGPAGWCRAAR
jgi:hypothetical protein